jgi:hypothetical protein
MTAMRLCPAARAGSSSASKGEYPIRMPRAWRMSSGLGNDHRHRPPLVLRIRHHGEHRINPPARSNRSPMEVAMPVHCAPSTGGLMRARTIRRNGPKCSSSCRPASRARPCTRSSSSRIVRLDELARLAAAARIRAARHPTIGAQLAQRPCTDFWRIKTTGSRPAIKFSEPERDGTPFHTQQQR